MKNKKTKFREFELESENKIFLGKDEKSNDELMKKYKGKENIIMHTSSPGSPFGVIENLNPSKEEIYLSGSIVASYSQDWRDNKKDVIVHVFKGKDVYKDKKMKLGTFGVRKHDKIKIKKEKIAKL